MNNMFVSFGAAFLILIGVLIIYWVIYWVPDMLNKIKNYLINLKEKR